MQRFNQRSQWLGLSQQRLRIVAALGSTGIQQPTPSLNPESSPMPATGSSFDSQTLAGTDPAHLRAPQTVASPHPSNLTACQPTTNRSCESVTFSSLPPEPGSPSPCLRSSSHLPTDGRNGTETHGRTSKDHITTDPIYAEQVPPPSKLKHAFT